MDIDLKARERSIRTLIVSDVHLGNRFAQADHFLAYLNRFRPEQLFILGDFLDGWELSTRWHWKPVYSQIIDRLFDLAEGGTELFYTPGNHDQFLRSPEVARLLRKSGLCVNVCDEFVFEAQSGRRFLMLHGDRFDVVETRHQWLSMLVTCAYKPLLRCNSFFNRITGRTGSPYSACAYIKHKVKTAVRFFSHFEDNLFQYVRSRGCDGVICGHIHTPGVITSAATTYINTGDWVENCTALVEQHDGELVLESFFPDRAPQTIRLAGAMTLEDIQEPAAIEDPVMAFSDSVAQVA
jgi:UDP-2,3-diacylglucosamine pyrophosphatase LpxH